MTTPTPKQIVRKRNDAGLTQTQASALINRGLRTWQKYEGGELPMDPVLWEMFNIKLKERK